MKLLHLAGRICRAFHENDNRQMRTIQKVKGNQLRDVVTNLDLRLHDISERFVRERMSGTLLLSEEGWHKEVTTEDLLAGEWLIVDPMDGSNNYAAGLP